MSEAEACCGYKKTVKSLLRPNRSHSNSSHARHQLSAHFIRLLLLAGFDDANRCDMR